MSLYVTMLVLTSTDQNQETQSGLREKYTPLVLLPTWLVHKTPFQTTGETSSSATSKTRILHSLNNPRVALQENVLRPVPVAAGLHDMF